MTKSEKKTFVIYGFLLKLQFLLRKTRANVVVYATDSDSSIRKEKYSIYKEKRSQNKTEEQIALDKIAMPQFKEIVEKIIPRIGYQNVFGAEGYEADDVIGRVCKSYKDDQIIIVSTDQDYYQLLTENVCIFEPRKNSWYTITDFERDYEIAPKYWKRVKSIGGCSSDNVKGVEVPPADPTKKVTHVAEKGALNFIKGKMGTNTRAYKAITSRAGKDIINRNKGLVILPMRGTPEYVIKRDRLRQSGLKEIAVNYGFDSILSDWNSWRKTLRLL